MAKTYAGVIGAVLTLVGIVGFLMGDQALMGLQFNTTHNLIHLASGVIGLACAYTGGGKAAKPFAQIFGTVYTLVALAGFAGVPEALTTMLNLNTPYNLIHLVVGVWGLVAGFKK